MAGDISEEVSRLLSQGKEPKDIRIMLEQKGYAGQDIAAALETSRGVQGRRRNSEDDRNSKFLLTREVFDRIGYGAATPQFVNILFWLSAQSHPYIIFIIGVLNGLKTVSSVFFSNLLQAYDDRHKISKNSIAMAGIIFGFSFLGMAFAILLRNIWVFSASFLLGSVAIVAYGDLYQRFVNNLIRKERRMPLLRSAAYWGVLITGASLLLTGWLLDKFPMSGVPWEVTLFGITYSLKVYGYLLAFEITAFSFILAGYITSLLSDRRDLRSYRFFHFLREQHRETLKKLHVFWSSKYVALMTLASVFTGMLQIIITAYSGIAIYKIFSESGTITPFLMLAVVYFIAIIASFLGPWFTQKIHRSTGLAPTMVFGTLLMAILPLVLVYNKHTLSIILGLCASVIGGSITGFGQGLLAQKLLSDELRQQYFQAQSYVLMIPYLILIPVISYVAYAYTLELTFQIVVVGLVAVVMPLYFILVMMSQRLHL